MRMISYPLMLPAKCITCGYGGADRRYADTELDIEFYGVVYICEECLHHWFKELNYDGFMQLKKIVSSLEYTVERLEDERNALLGAIRTIERSPALTISQSTLDFEPSTNITELAG